MIVLKFGGTSVADASRMASACAIVRERVKRRPVIVVSALAGVTDLLIQAVARARDGDHDGLEPVLADLERRHRWVVAEVVERPGARHDLALQVDALFEELRQLLRSVRVLKDATPRAADTLLAFGEALSSTILVAALRDRAVAAVGIDPKTVLVTDARHGAAEPIHAETEIRARKALLPRLDAGEIPVLGGFVGATANGVPTTIGRGGSDTSASVLAAALGAEEVQIWTDVDGWMSADPRIVPGAWPLDRLSFAEAAELAHYGAKVLHPASIAPAVRRGIPVRILNTLRPDAAGTVVLGDDADPGGRLASIASRRGLATIRVIGTKMRMDPRLLLRVLEAVDGAGITPDLVVSSEVGVTLLVPEDTQPEPLEHAVRGEATVATETGRAVLCVVGSALRTDASLRGGVLASLAALNPDVATLGASGTSATAVLSEQRLHDAVRELHARFFAASEGA